MLQKWFNHKLRKEVKMKDGIQDKVQIKGKFHLQLFDKDGKLKDERLLENTVPANGLAHIADQLAAKAQAAMGWMAIGTGTPSATLLGAELDRNALTSKTSSTNVVTYVGDWAAGDGTGALIEAGIFNVVTANTITMLCSASFPVVNKGAADTLAITWTLTAS